MDEVRMMYHWIIAHSTIVGLMIDCLALLATVALTIAIYWLQRRHEIEREQQEEKAKQYAIQEAARVFIIDNEDDLEYLPLCQVAAKMRLKGKHHRSIYTRFIRCKEAVQKEILRQQNIDEINISENSVNHAIDAIREDFEKHDFGKDILYDGAKYYYRAFYKYRDNIIEDEHPRIFPRIIPLSPRRQAALENKRLNIPLSQYIQEYLEVEGKDEYQGFNGPLDILWKTQDLENCDENKVTFWVMRLILDSCFELYPNLSNTVLEYGVIKTQEDMFYYTALVLYETYCNNGENENND